MKSGLLVFTLAGLAAAQPHAGGHQHFHSKRTLGPGSSGHSDLGIVYNPYNNDGTCKGQQMVNADIAMLSAYSTIRIYGTDCMQCETVKNAVKNNPGQHIMAGVYDIANAASEAETIISAFKDDWELVHTLTVGNEAINSGTASVSQAVAAVNQVRSMVRAAGFKGGVSIVDTFNKIIENPELCEASDSALANCHAFFDSQIVAPEAGKYVYGQMKAVKAACHGKTTIITETGWPSLSVTGQVNGLAVPGKLQQQQAISSIRSEFPDGGAILFSAWNNLWQTNSGDTFGCETQYGIYNDNTNQGNY